MINHIRTTTIASSGPSALYCACNTLYRGQASAMAIHSFSPGSAVHDILPERSLYLCDGYVVITTGLI